MDILGLYFTKRDIILSIISIALAVVVVYLFVKRKSKKWYHYFEFATALLFIMYWTISFNHFPGRAYAFLLVLIAGTVTIVGYIIDLIKKNIPFSNLVGLRFLIYIYWIVRAFAPSAFYSDEPKITFVTNTNSYDPEVEINQIRNKLRSQKILTGDWVNEKYVKEIRAGQPIGAAQQDGILVSFDSYNDSMGYANFYFHAGPGPFEITKKDSAYQFSGTAFNFRDTTYNVKIVSAYKIVIGNDVYLKLDDSAMGDLRIVEKFLFNGKYKMQDGHEVEFDDYGSITGLDSNDSYSAEYDYIAGPDGSVNRISMGKENGKQHDYGFKYNGDTLFICQIIKDKNDTTDEPSGFKRSLGKVIYKMWRTGIPITN